VRRTNATRHYIIARAEDGALVAQARGVFFSVDPDKGQIVRMPTAMLDDFALSISE